MATKQDLEAATRRIFEQIEKRKVMISQVDNNHFRATQGDHSVIIAINNSSVQRGDTSYR